MSKILQDLKNFPGRFGLNLIRPDKLQVFISVCSKEKIAIETTINLMQLYACPDPKFSVKFQKGDSLISRARADSATKFLKTGSEILLFIDDDMVFDPINAIKLCQNMIDKDLDILSGVCIVKSETNPFIQCKLFENQELELTPNAVPVEVRYVGTGFMGIRRLVFEKMVEELKLPFCMPQGFYPFFETMTINDNGVNRYLGEDWAFCEKARQLGFKVHIDPSIRIGHIGKYVYTPDDLCREQRKNAPNIKYREMPE